MRKFFVLLAASFLLLLPIRVQAEAAPSVKYHASQGGYYLYQASGKKVSTPGLYALKGQKEKGRVFRGIYAVLSDGRINTRCGVHYVPKPKTIGGQYYYSGYYYFEKGGKLAEKSGIVYCKKTKINDSVFRGYYFYNRAGRICAKTFGLIYLNEKASNGKNFHGYYYRDSMSRINTQRGIRKITSKDEYGKKFPGYRFFDKGGCLDTTQKTHKLNLTYKGKKYQGYYCFAGKDGRMVKRKGLVNVGDTYYYITNADGKCLTSAKRKLGGFSYSFEANGQGRRTSTKLGGLTSKLNSMISGYGGTWSVYVKRLDDNDSLTINDQPLYAASLIKAFVMASLYDQIRQGNVKETAEINALLQSMITISSNTAYNELVMRHTSRHDFLAGCAVINAYLVKNGYAKTQIHTAYAGLGVSDGGMNCTSVKDSGKLLEAIYRENCVAKESSQKMKNLLLAQQLRSKIPAGVPSGVKVANKTGETSFSDHDIAIVYSPKCTYIICVMSINSANSASRVAQISKAVYEYLN